MFMFGVGFLHIYVFRLKKSPGILSGDIFYSSSRIIKPTLRVSCNVNFINPFKM